MVGHGSPEAVKKAADDLSSALQKLYEKPGTINEDTLHQLETAGKDISDVLDQQADSEGKDGKNDGCSSNPQPPEKCSVQGTALPVDPEILNKTMRDMHNDNPSEMTGGQCCCDLPATACNCD